ncbi:ribosomal-processing cysteine protease Prp [Bacillaceae bacterium Marseille-Q3522]|nr:ribosomal-processing cysteine protease Prp [Bacillaceae bacterium Marseille-Q3522]
MIKIDINRTKAGFIQSFAISGHAFYAKKGNDIVCAGVSAVSFGSVNAVIALTGIEPEIEQTESGFLRCEFPDDLPAETQEKVQLLLEAMVVSLKSIEEEFGKHVKITISKQEVN